MNVDFLIVGQGLAGTLLAWEFERAGFSFAVADAGRTDATTPRAAGIINPITGRRMVKSWRVDALLPLARSTYREIAAALGEPLWRDLRVRREFAKPNDRLVVRQKKATGVLAPFLGPVDDDGFWIDGAGRIDLDALVRSTRARWQSQGRFRAETLALKQEAQRHQLVIDCTGLQGTTNGTFDFVPWEFSKGEILEIEVPGLSPDVVLNRGHWVLPVGPGRAWVGATHEPGKTDTTITDLARDALTASAKDMLARAFTVVGQKAGVRVNLPDKRPVVGRHPRETSLGIVNGLGAKGALIAPALARQWVNHLTEGVPFDAEVDVARFFPDRP